MTTQPHTGPCHSSWPSFQSAAAGDEESFESLGLLPTYLEGPWQTFGPIFLPNTCPQLAVQCPRNQRSVEGPPHPSSIWTHGTVH
jgi:hypothetical protein